MADDAATTTTETLWTTYFDEKADVTLPNGDVRRRQACDRVSWRRRAN